MEQQQQQEPKAYKTENISEDISYEVLENGDVKVIQKNHTEIYWKSREFTSLLRQNESALKMFQDAQSEEYIEKMKDQEANVQKVIDEIRPHQLKAEENTKIEYERMRKEGLLKNIKLALDDKETKYAWFQNVWNRTKQELKTEVLKELSSEYQSKLAKVMQKMKRKNI